MDEKPNLIKDLRCFQSLEDLGNNNLNIIKI